MNISSSPFVILSGNQGVNIASRTISWKWLDPLSFLYVGPDQKIVVSGNGIILMLC